MGKSGGSYRGIKTQQNVHLHPSSCLMDSFPRCVLYHELVLTSREYMRNVIIIKPEWLHEVAGHFYEEGEGVEIFKRKKLKK